MLDDFLNLLKETPSGEVFNPWWEVDIDNDKYNDSYKVRQQNLRSYFSERLGQIQYIILAEALRADLLVGLSTLYNTLSSVVVASGAPHTSFPLFL